MKEKDMTAYFMRVDKEQGIPYRGYAGTIEDSLAALQRYVNFDEPGGWIQAVALGDGILVLCHDEGKLLGFPANRAWLDDEGRVVDVFAGNIMAVRHTGEEFSGILASDIPYVEKHLRPVILGGGGCVQIPEGELPEYRKG
ncbi:MAG: DUF3846 domain-containing protein [Firmicutes bacterium]|nr:DUF3846 domain-containing protein [Bacillota bacterium]